MDQITARQLYDTVQERMTLRWVAGMNGQARALQPGIAQDRRPSLIGYLNTIYPNKIQIIGSEEIRYLDGMNVHQRRKIVRKIAGYDPVALIVTRNQPIPSDLHDIAEETDMPIWSSSKRSHELLTWLQYHLARLLAPRVTLHGVFLEIFSVGVLLTGESGSGKSEMALELISRGHRLVADDAPEFKLIAPDVIDGTCPEMLKDLLEVRGLGVLNMLEMFGHTAVKPSKYLRLIIHLKPWRDGESQVAMTRITGATSYRNVLEVPVPMITLPVAPGRNLSVLAEVAVRSHMLRSKGINPAQTFIDRQAHQMRHLVPW